MNNKYVVYIHTNRINGKSYVGITMQDPQDRWGMSGSGYKNQPKFYNAIKKYGWDSFIHQILEEGLSEEEALELETFYIQYYNSIDNGYNVLLEGIKSYPRSKKVYCLTSEILYNSIKEASLATGIPGSRIIQNCKGLIGPVKSTQWTYWDDINNTYFPPKVFNRKRSTIQIYCVELDRWFESEREAIDELYLDKSGLIKALNGTRNGTGGYHFVRGSEMHKIPLVMKKKTGKNRRVYCEETGRFFGSLTEAAQFCNVSEQAVMKNCQNKTSSCANYHFKYQEDIDFAEIMRQRGYLMFLQGDEETDE